MLVGLSCKNFSKFCRLDTEEPRHVDAPKTKDHGISDHGRNITTEWMRVLYIYTLILILTHSVFCTLRDKSNFISHFRLTKCAGFLDLPKYLMCAWGVPNRGSNFGWKNEKGGRSWLISSTQDTANPERMIWSSVNQ